MQIFNFVISKIYLPIVSLKVHELELKWYSKEQSRKNIEFHYIWKSDWETGRGKVLPRVYGTIERIDTSDYRAHNRWSNNMTTEQKCDL